MFNYNEQYFELVNKLSHLGIVFTPDRSLRGTLYNLSVAALKLAIFN